MSAPQTSNLLSSFDFHIYISVSSGQFQVPIETTTIHYNTVMRIWHYNFPYVFTLDLTIKQECIEPIKKTLI